MLEEYLTAPTTEGKVKQLIGFLVQQPADDISNDFNFKEVDPERAGYFNTMIAEALSGYFMVQSEPEDIENLNTVQDIIDRVENA